MNTRNYIILKYLKEAGDYVTSENLSAICNVSTKTILKDIQLLNEEMKASNNFIEVKPSHGIRININDIEEYVNLSNSYRPFKDNVLLSVTEREDWIEKYLIETNDWVKLERLCELVYVSPSVLSQSLKSVRKSLKQYDLTLEQKPHYGMKIEGREFNKRLCLSSIYISYIDQRENFPGYQFNGEELEIIQKISDILNDVLMMFKISMSEVAVQNFIIDIFVSLRRINQGIILNATEKMIIDVSRWTDSIVAVELAKRIDTEFNIEMGDQEIVSLSIHLASKRIIKNIDESVHRIIRNFDVNKIVDSMFEAIYEQWHIDFYQDNELRKSLLLHLIPLEVRSRYNVVLQNPLIDKIKQQNILAYHLATTACKQLVDYHGNHLSDEEIGYVALHLELALFRKQIKENKNILVMCGIGRGTSSTLAYKIKEMYWNYINEIKTVDYIGLKNYDFTGIDLLISSIPIKYSLPIPMIEVNYFLSDHDKKRIFTYLDNQEVFHMENFVENHLILKHIDVNTKEEAIEFIIKNTINDNNLIKYMIESDEFSNYELENKIAILASNSSNQNTKVIIGILTKPILWNKKKVQLIIMPLIGNEKNYNIFDLFKELSYLAQNSVYIKRIIKKQSEEEIIKIFNEIEEILN